MVTIEELQVILGCDASQAEEVFARIESIIDRWSASIGKKVQEAAAKTSRATKTVAKAKESIGSPNTKGGNAFKGVETSLATVSRKLDGVQAKAKRTYKTLHKMTHMSTSRGNTIRFTEAAAEKARVPRRTGIDDGREKSLATASKSTGGPRGPDGIGSPATARAIESAVRRIADAYQKAALKAGEYRKEAERAADTVAETASRMQSAAGWGYDKSATDYVNNFGGGSGGKKASDRFGPLTKENILQEKIDLAEQELDFLYKKYNEVVAHFGKGTPQDFSLWRKINTARDSLRRLDDELRKVNAKASSGVGGAGAGSGGAGTSGAAATGAAVGGAAGTAPDSSGYTLLRDRIVELEAEVERLRSQLGSLDGQAGRTGNIITRAFGRVRSVLSRVGSGLKRVIGLFGRFRKTTGKSTGILGKFGSTLKRVAIRMLAMRLIRGIINSFSDGFDILKQKSESCNTAFSQLSAASNVMKASLGVAIMPIVKALVPLFNQLAIAVANCANLIARFFASLTGQAKYTAVSVGSALGSASDSASGAGKEAKNSLADFDEINLIQKSGAGGGAGDATSLMADIQDVATGFSALAEAMKGGDWEAVGTIIGQKITGALNKAYTFLTTYDWEGLGRSAADLLNGAFAGTDFTLAGKTLGASLNALVDSAFGFADQFDWSQLAQKVSGAINGFFAETDWGKLGQTISLWVTNLLSSIKTFLLETDWMEIGRCLGEAIANIDWLQVLADVIVIIVEALFAAVAGIWGLLKEIGTSIVDGVKEGLTWDDVGQWLKEKICDPIVEAFKRIFKIGSPSKVLEELAGYIMDGLKLGLVNGLGAVIKFFTGLWEDIKRVFADVKQWFTDKFTEAKDGIHTAFSAIGSWFGQRWADIKNIFASVGTWFREKFQTAKNNVHTAFQSIGSWFGQRWDDIKGVFNSVGQWFSDIFGGAWDAITGVFNSVASWFDRNVSQPIKDAFKGAINSVIQAINKMIGGLNKVKINLPNWDILGSLAGKSYGINIPKIPTLAKGGLAYGDTVARVGEYAGSRVNPEVIAPLSNLKQLLSESSGNKEQLAVLKQQNALLTTQIALLKQLVAKELSIFPSVGLGQVVSRSIDMFEKV